MTLPTVYAYSNNPASPFYNASAPNLTGQAGSLTTLFDAVLVNGFGSAKPLGWTIGQTTTSKRQYVNNGGAAITAKIDNGSGSAGNTLTVTAISAPTGVQNGTIAIGSQITVPGGANCTVTAFGSGSGGTGTYTVNGSAQLVASESMTAASGATTATGVSLWVDDSAVTTAKEARVAGYGTMSATTPTGTGQFPTSAQSSIGTGMLVIRKSITADSTVRYWTIIGDNTYFMLFTETGDYTGPIAAFSFYFGDFFSYSSSDTSNACIIGRQIENNNVANSNTTVLEPLPQLVIPNSTGLSNTMLGQYVFSNFTNLGGPIAFGKHSDQTKMGVSTANGYNGMQLGYLGAWVNSGGNNFWINEFNYPNGPDAGLYSAPVYIHHSGNVRGYLKGLWCPLQHLPLDHNDTFSGTGNLNGRSFAVQALVAVTNGNGPSAGYAAQGFIETTSTGVT